MELSIFDLSKHLGVVPETIERWVRQGKLPVSKKGLSYSFHTRELEKWAASHNINLNLSNKALPEKSGEIILPLSEALLSGGIYFNIPGNDVKAVLKASIERISKISDDFKPNLLDQLMKREQALSTGVGNGIAIPHPREQLDYLDVPLLSICFLANPVDYHAFDHQPVSILCFLLSPVLKMHLHLLSALSFCLRNNEFTSFLKSVPDPDDLMDKIKILQKANPI